jgi:hypothetical protein
MHLWMERLKDASNISTFARAAYPGDWPDPERSGGRESEIPLLTIRCNSLIPSASIFLRVATGAQHHGAYSARPLWSAICRVTASACCCPPIAPPGHVGEPLA